MTAQQDPPRLREAEGGAPARLRELFDTAAREQPTAAQLSRLEAKLAPQLAEPATVPLPPGPGRFPVALKWGLGVLALGGVAVIALSARQPADDAAIPSLSRAGASSVPAPPAPTMAPPVVTTPTAGPAVSAPSASPVPAAPATSATAQPRPASSGSGLPEDRLLEKARAALRREPALSLALTREHQQRFAGGVLTQEREVIAIEALRRLGRTAEADRRTERFEQRYPGSAHLRKLDAPPPPR